MLGNIGPLEIIIVLIIALIVFGPKRLPELGNSLGRGIREFKETVTGETRTTTTTTTSRRSAPRRRPRRLPPTTEPAEAEVAHDKRS